MIEIYDIIEAINALTDTNIVLHRSMKVHPKFKVYKIFCYDLYKVESQDKELILSYSHTVNSPSEDILESWKECDKLYLKELIKLITTNEFKELINGV